METKKSTQEQTPPAGISNKQTSENISPTNDKGRDIGVIILNIVLALITILLLGYIAYKNGYIDLDNILNIQDEKSENSQEDLTPEDAEILETYEGEVLSAILPSGWRMEEYFNGEGTSMIMEDGEYTGLTGIKIFNGEKEIMHIESVYGIGFEACPEMPKFLDSSTEYEEEQESIAAEIDESVTYLDYTDTPYSEFEWLEKRVRRIETGLYYDTVLDNEYFEPQCEVAFFQLEDFGFEDSDGRKGTVYMYTISQEATDEELELLDNILTSMIAN